MGAGKDLPLAKPAFAEAAGDDRRPISLSADKGNRAQEPGRLKFGQEGGDAPGRIGVNRLLAYTVDGNSEVAQNRLFGFESLAREF
jgi:hypothetical protein